MNSTNGKCSKTLIANLYSSLRAVFPGVTKRALLKHYLPLTGALSHSFFTLHIFSPSVYTRLFSVYDLAASNVALINAHLGIGFYIFFRPHMHRLWRWRRVEFSVFVSVMFNFGSLLLSIFLKGILPKETKTPVRSLIALTLSFFLLHRGSTYVNYVDKRIVSAGKTDKGSSSSANGHSRTP